MDNQHKKIAGYRDLSQGEIDAMNRFKRLEQMWNRLIDDVKEFPDIDLRQLEEAISDGENAFMRAVRAIAKPSRLVASNEDLEKFFGGSTNG